MHQNRLDGLPAGERPGKNSLADIERAIAAVQPEPAPAAGAEQLLRLGESVLEHWMSAQGGAPTDDRREGFRLLALHRQGASGDPSFNACRESCREFVYLTI